MKKTHIVLSLIVLTLFSCTTGKYSELGDGIFAEIQTTKGAIVVQLEYEKTPVTVANFISLAEGTNSFVSEQYKGKKYYDSLTFHRVMKDFMIQGGDPLASGMGNPGYKFMDEFNDSLVHDKKGILSMANSGPGTNGSQFFITHAPTPHLNNVHTVFGEVIVGLNIVDSLALTPVGDGNKPVEPMFINTVEIIRNGTEAKNFDAVALMTDYFAKEEERQAVLKKERLERAEAAKIATAAIIDEFTEQKSKAKQLPSGLKIYTLKDAKGEKIRYGTKVLVNYAGFLENGTLFDTSVKSVAEKFNKFEQLNQMHRGNFSPTPMDYSPDSPLFPGFREALLTMKVGDKIRAFLPSHLGLGEQGGGPIPPNSDLVFDIEITEKM